MFYFGIDVSRGKLDCAVVSEEGKRFKRARIFSNGTLNRPGFRGGRLV
ncbi:ROK family protein [Rhodoferax sp. PAMC 29310]|nr:ROK family protein [Rhodoferax sp. PAMC 29310]